jgi:allantoicase
MINNMSEQVAFTALQNLAAANFGAQALYCTDDFFAEMDNLLKSGRGIFIADKYTERGKWMDGWESRRKRVAGHDYCIIRLGAAGRIAGFDIDTNHFLGNHPPFASIEVCSLPLDTDVETLKNYADWEEIIPKMPLNPGSQHFVAAPDTGKSYTFVKLHIYPDGGVARLKVYGEVFTDWSKYDEATELDLASANLGAKSVLCNDMFFSHMSNLIMPFRGANMGDGWETKRNRTPNNRDWVVVKLAHVGKIRRVLIDTCHFKGNYPDTFSLDGINLPEGSEITAENVHNLAWVEVLGKQKLQADFEHYYNDLPTLQAFTHVRLNIFPDGGVSRMRLWGNISK